MLPPRKKKSALKKTTPKRKKKPFVSAFVSADVHQIQSWHMAWRDKLAAATPTGNLVRAQAEMDLSRLAECFTEKRNPAAAWLCWHLAQKWQMPVPPAVSAEVERFSTAIAELAVRALDDPASIISRDTVSEHWGPPSERAKDDTRRGEAAIGEQLHDWFRNLEIAEKVHQKRTRENKHGRKITRDQAVAEVAEEVGLSEDSVKVIAEKRRSYLLARDKGVDHAAQNDILDTLMNELRSKKKIG